MNFETYRVVIYFTNHLGHPEQSTFEVMAYDTVEAENKAFDEFSDIYDNHIGTLDYETEIME